MLQEDNNVAQCVAHTPNVIVENGKRHDRIHKDKNGYYKHYVPAG